MKSGTTILPIFFGKFSSEKDDQDEKLYHHGVVIQPPIFALPQFQQPVCSSSMVNISSGISPSSVRNCQMEPPSSQSYHGYNYLPLWPDEVKRVGIKRPYPFPPEFPPVPTFHCKFPPRYDAPMCTANSDSRTYLKRFDISPEEVLEEPSTRSSLNRSVQQRVFRFFPPPNVQIGQPGNTHGEVGGKVDLNLKL
ncbi:hypothetical protein RDI58_018877 [Solanum bulbocastanum]|uniref:Uncharacterized protein n=1 Tax=Solanum bulbocastanum TaxID=147425 RepID=A0AAN8TI53_SOLBU